MRAKMIAIELPNYKAIKAGVKIISLAPINGQTLVLKAKHPHGKCKLIDND